MTDLDPVIWQNKTLGEAGAGPFLDEVEAQAKEDRVARLEGREPRIAVNPNRYPKLPSTESVPSLTETLQWIEPPVESSVTSEDEDFDLNDFLENDEKESSDE